MCLQKSNLDSSDGGIPSGPIPLVEDHLQQLNNANGSSNTMDKDSFTTKEGILYQTQYS